MRMAYIFDLGDFDFEAEPFVDTSGTSIIEFALGFDPEADIVVLMSATLVAGESYLKETVRRVLTNETGMAPRNKHVQRLAELKAEEQARQEEERRRAKARA
jgi:hypothetical protein